jgi:hypothetical protein
LHDDSVQQKLLTDSQHTVITACSTDETALEQSVRVVVQDAQPMLSIGIRAFSESGGSLVVAVRPYNPEGVQFIDDIQARERKDGWLVNSQTEVIADRPADKLLVSDYASGDVFTRLTGPVTASLRNAESSLGETHSSNTLVHCPVGMATAAGVYRFTGPRTELSIRVPLDKELAAMGEPQQFRSTVTWPQVRAETAALRIPDERLQSLYDGAVKTLILLSADEVVPGPYTYRRFWFRDACLMMNALLAIGLVGRCRKAIDQFPERQLRNGYFRSQEGEWDSNGQVLWILDRYEMLSGERLDE